MPPAPMAAWILYAPRRVPAVNGIWASEPRILPSGSESLDVGEILEATGLAFVAHEVGSTDEVHVDVANGARNRPGQASAKVSPVNSVSRSMRRGGVRSGR